MWCGMGDKWCWAKYTLPNCRVKLCVKSRCAFLFLFPGNWSLRSWRLNTHTDQGETCHGSFSPRRWGLVLGAFWAAVWAGVKGPYVWPLPVELSLWVPSCLRSHEVTSEELLLQHQLHQCLFFEHPACWQSPSQHAQSVTRMHVATS